MIIITMIKIMIKQNLLLSRGMIKVMLLRSGLKLLKLLGSIGRNLLLEGSCAQKLILSAGMPMLRLIRKGPSISYVSPGKHKLMNGSVSPPLLRDNLEHKWKNKAFLLIQGMIKLQNPCFISILKCGRKGEIKLHFLFKDLLEDGLHAKEPIR